MSFSRSRFVIGFVGVFTLFLAHTGSAQAFGGCETFEDVNGVIHFRAADELETFRCFGWVHGRNRGWQMDFLRRTFQGQAAELVGFQAVRTDFFMRVLNLTRRAEIIWETLPPEFKAKWEAYADGVNLGFKAMKLSKSSYEHEKLGGTIEPWLPTHSVGMLLLQAFDQTRRGFEIEVEESRRLKNHPTFAMLSLDDSMVPWATTILKDGEYKKATKVARVPPDERRASILAEASQWIGQSENLGGSNNWVVAGSRTKNGKPLLANDPHLSLKHPPFWHWVHPEFKPGPAAKEGTVGWEAIGASLPGVPLVVSGANATLAWGLTNSYLDAGELGSVADSELSPDRLVKIRPVVWFRYGFLKIPIFWKTFHRIKMDEKGTELPVLPIDEEAGRKLVLRWTGLELQGSDIQSFSSVMSSKTVQDVGLAFRQVGMPSFNFVFADSQGGIGYQLVGRVFGKQEAPAPGIAQRTLKQLMDIPVLSPEDRPAVMNPKRGFIATANNRHWPKDAFFHGGRGYSRPFRAHRIEELLMATPKHDVESFRKIQCDYQAQDARYLVSFIEKSLSKPGVMAQIKDQDRLKKFVSLLGEWKKTGYSTDPACRVCAWYRRLADRVGTKAGVTEAAVYQLYTSKTEMLEPFEKVLAEAFSEVASDFDQDQKKLGREEFPLWSVYHQASFEHMAGRQWFPSGSIATPGDAQTVSPGSSVFWESDRRYEHVWGASHRLVVELTQPVTVRVQVAGPNVDLPTKALDTQGSAWQKWNACTIESQLFPMNWEKRPEMGQYQKLDWKQLAMNLGSK